VTGVPVPFLVQAINVPAKQNISKKESCFFIEDENLDYVNNALYC
jgi:hypothetical protein